MPLVTDLTKSKLLTDMHRAFLDSFQFVNLGKMYQDAIFRAVSCPIKDEAKGYVPLAKTSDDVDIVVGKNPADPNKSQAVVQDRARSRAWTGEGASESEAATEAFRKFLGDRRSTEYVGKK